MDEYHKIHTLWKRDERGVVIPGEFSTPEFEYLANRPWVWTEKVDGTNVRVQISLDVEDLEDGGRDDWQVQYGGRTANAQMRIFLLDRLRAIFEDSDAPRRFSEAFQQGENDRPVDVTLYGEGYGARIQKGGGKYISDGVDFVLFDVKVGRWWLTREAVESIARILGIGVVPVVGVYSLIQACIEVGDDNVVSQWPGVQPEGLVGRPVVDLFSRSGQRIITKIKHEDFKRWVKEGNSLDDFRRKLRA